MARRTKKFDDNGNPIHRPHDDCTRANYDANNAAVRYCFDGVNGNPEFRGWMFCSRGPHCAPAADFVRGGNTGFMVCNRHSVQSYDTKGKRTGKNSKTRTTRPVPRGPRNKGTGTASGRVTKPATPKKSAAAPLIRAAAASAEKKRRAKKAKEEEGDEGLFVPQEEDEDEDEEVEDEYERYEEPAGRRRRTPEPDDDGYGGMGGGMGALSALLTA